MSYVIISYEYVTSTLPIRALIDYIIIYEIGSQVKNDSFHFRVFSSDSYYIDIQNKQNLR